MEKISPAAKFWAGIALYVLAADTYLWRHDFDTMSIQWERWLKTPHGRTVCAAIWGLLTAHLFWRTPLPFQTTAKRCLGGKTVTTVLIESRD